jgi:hypothetical protein
VLEVTINCYKWITDPVFIGYYWLPDSVPREPIAPNIACLDYSVAKGGRLTAYRWEGEQQLNGGKFLGH